MDTMACFVNRILFLGAVVWLTASANLIVDYNWPEPKQNIDRFPHESSCDHFYLMLSEEDITLEKCPDGQLFDYKKHSCISDKEHVHCFSRHFEKITHDHMHMKHKKHFRCPYPWGKYPHIHNCEKYHLCLHGKSMVKKCAPFELFDKISRKCIASIDAVCADKTDVVEHGYMCPKTWGSFTYSKDCSKYYECLQRKPSLRTCQKGYLFDDRLMKCSPKEHVDCGVRQNPYEKVSTDVPEIPSVPSTAFIQKSTSADVDETKITANLRIKSTPEDTSTTLKEITSTSQETPTALKEDTSSPQEISSTLKENTSTQEPSKKPLTNEILSHLTAVEDNNKETKKNKIIETASTTVGLKSEEQQKTNDGTQTNGVKLEEQQKTNDVTQTVGLKSEEQQKTNDVTPTVEVKLEEQQKINDVSQTVGVKLEEQQKTNDVTQTVGVKLEQQQKTNDVTETASAKTAFSNNESKVKKEQVTISPKIVSDDESDLLKKDVSTEERDPNDIFAKHVAETIIETKMTSEASPVSSVTASKTGCVPEDSMCLVEKDGTVVKCTSSKDLQPHPKDERRFLDCTESKIHVFNCPQGLTFDPKRKKCVWKLIMG